MITTILIAVDSSEHSFAAARIGIELAKQLAATATVLYVIDEAKALPSPDTGIVIDEAVVVLKKEAEQILESIRQLYGDAIIPLMPTGNPKTSIVQTAEEVGAQVIVLGSHGHSGLRHLLLGSTAEYVMRHSSIPVFIVPATM